MPNQNQNDHNEKGGQNRGFGNKDEDKQREPSKPGGENMPNEKRGSSQDQGQGDETVRKGDQQRGGSAGKTGQMADEK